jgi:GT2 family glycosyltransferase
LSAAAELSVLVVTHNAWSWTERALAAVHAHTTCAFEVVVVDNASSDGTPERVRAAFPGVRVVANAGNEGFGPAMNRAAEAASAPTLALLNSDTVVGPAWYGPLASRLARPGVGAVVPALVNEDGTLQGAGALVGADGGVVSYGAGADPGDGRFAFARATDFGAAACLVLRRADFQGVGGFDPMYAPAYFEDVDLCFKLADRGLRTVYEPAVKVLHGLYGSGSPTDAAALYERNRPRFVARWRSALASRVPTISPFDARREIAARDATAEGRVLVTATELPEPSDDLRALLDERPWLRLTVLACRAGADPASWWRLGAEVIVRPDVETILELRALHYDVALPAREHRPAVETHQPCARLLDPPASAAAIEDALGAPAAQAREVAVLRAHLAHRTAEVEEARTPEGPVWRQWLGRR